jgi:hypothetical protein
VTNLLVVASGKRWDTSSKSKQGKCDVVSAHSLKDFLINVQLQLSTH